MYKKTIALILSLITIILALVGCGKAKPDQPLTVYSFHGSNEQMTITNGVIVLSEEKDVFYGGNLEVNENFPSDTTSFSTKFYVSSDNERHTVFSNSTVDQTGSFTSVEGALGTIFVNIDEGIADNLKNGLCFELTTINKNGEKNVYQLQLSVSEITTEAEN